MLTMEKLLLLVPGFRQVVENRIWGTVRLEISANYTKSNTGPVVVDHHNPTIKVVLQGQEKAGCIVNGVNVISKTTCNRLGITD